MPWPRYFAVPTAVPRTWSVYGSCKPRRLPGARALVRPSVGMRPALLSQLPLVLLIVAYTMISLWILSGPIVKTG